MGRPRVPPALRREWERRLRESGHVDIEQSNGELVNPAHVQRARVRAERGTLTADYYRMAAQWTWTHIWRSRLHRRIWELHGEGMNVRAIERAMVPSGYRHHSRMWPVIDATRDAMRRAGHLEDGNADEAPSLLATELATFPTFDVPLHRNTRRSRTNSGWS